MADEADFSDIIPSGAAVYLGGASSQWTLMADAVQGLAAAWRAIETTGAIPDDHAIRLKLGDAGAHNDVSLYYDGSSIHLQQNTGTEATPVWTTRWTVHASTGIVTQTGVLTLGGAMAGNGELIAGVTTYNGVTVEAHQARHLPGGADALATAVVADIASANAEGSAASLARSDHAHRGLLSFRKAGDTILYGAVTVTGGTRVTLTQAGQDVSIAVDPVQRTYQKKDVVDQAIATATETAIIWTGTDVLVAFPGADGVKDYRVNVFLNLTQVAVDTIVSLRQGTSTTPGSNTLLFEALWATDSVARATNFAIQSFEVQNVTTGDSLMVTVTHDAATSQTYHGSGTTAEKFCYVEIEEIISA